MQISKSMFPVGGVFPSIIKLNESLQKLQVQLASQQKASTLSEFGQDRVFDLTLRSRLSRLDAYNTNIDTTDLRLDFLDNSVSRLDELESDVRGDLSASGIGSDGIAMASASDISYARLDEILAILNGDLNGRYMFAGNKTDAKPVVTADMLINGDTTHAGLKQVIAERKLADSGGASGHGRIDIDQAQLSAAAGASNEVVISEADATTHPNGPVISAVTTTSAAVTATPGAGPPPNSTIAFTGVPADGDTITLAVDHHDGSTESFTFKAVTGTPANPGEFQIGADADATAANLLGVVPDLFHDNTVTVAEDGDHPFGFKLDAVTTDSSGISVLSQTTTQPHVLQVRIDAQPTAGDAVRIAYSLPDGTTGTIELVATADDPPATGAFTIGTDTDDTAANFAAAVTTKLDALRDVDLAAASANKATEDFITRDGAPPQRVVGPPFDSATALVNGTSANTVIWYTGQSVTDGSARRTAAARVDESTMANYGVLGNEQGLADLVRATAVVAAEEFSTSVTSDADRYQALAERQVRRLADTNNSQNGSIEVISLELGLAKATVGSAKDRHASYGTQLETMLSDIESVDINEVAMQLLAVRTRLEASYQTMSRLSELSLVNFMS